MNNNKNNSIKKISAAGLSISILLLLFFAVFGYVYCMCFAWYTSNIFDPSLELIFAIIPFYVSLVFLIILSFAQFVLLIIAAIKVTTTSHRILLILGIFIFILGLIGFALVYNTAKKDLSSNDQYQKPDNQNSEAMSPTTKN